MAGVGIGAQVGALNADVGVNAQLPSIGGLFNFVGQGINAGLNLGAGLGGGLGVGVNGDAGGGAGGQGGAGVGVGINGGAGGSNGGGIGAGVGINGGGEGGNGGGIGAGVGINGGAGGDANGGAGTGAGAGVGAGLGGGAGIGGQGQGQGQAGGEAGVGASGNESSPVNGGAGAGVGFGGGYGVSLVPVPVVPISISAGGEGGAGAGLSASVGALPNGSPQCTVQGGPARMIYFPPVGGQAAAGAQGQAPGAPAPVGGSAITTLGQTFQPGSAYISCQTLWAGYTDDKGSVVQTGPTFTNAIFPVPSDQVSTQCQSTLTAAESDHNTQAWGAPQQCDFNNIGAAQPTCQQVAPPPNIINQVPEFAPYLFWSMDWRQPQYISQEGSPAPPQGSAWAGPEPGCTPSIVQTTTNIVPTTPVAPTAAPSVAPTGVPASQPPSAETSPAYTGPQAGGSNGTSPTTTGPAPYTGNAAPAFSKAGKSSFAIAALLLSVLVL